MDIGGVDVTVPTKFDPSQTLVEAIKAIEGVWGTSIVEIDNPTEMFVYRSKEAVEGWNKEGWNEQYARDMVDLISINPGELTIVLEDEHDPILSKIISAITDVLKL
jgi:hypothetical protein